MPGRWLTRILDSIADRGLDLFRTGTAEIAPGNVAGLCHALITGKGEASGIALSREILSHYRQMSAEQKADFFQLLLDEFGTDPELIRQTADTYLTSRSHQDFQKLTRAVEPPRQELFRQLNMAPNGTAQLVNMRGDLLLLLRERPDLSPVDDDFRHILASWFNRGFLAIARIDWNTPAHILEKLINYESVHAIHGWDDLRRRLMADRRCFAFFHPALPDDPLIFVEVALVKGIPVTIKPLLDINADTLPVDEADTAVFYSINNTLRGLRGISFGNFLIKQVLEELRGEFPWIERFVTLSPMPRFASVMIKALKGEQPELDPGTLEQLIREEHAELASGNGQKTTFTETWLERIRQSPGDEKLFEATRDLCLAYLATRREKGGMLDPVASFHLSNGARLERINVNADTTPERQKESFGCMVNYLYDPEKVERNHELFVSGSEIPMSRQLARQYRAIQNYIHNPDSMKKTD